MQISVYSKLLFLAAKAGLFAATLFSLASCQFVKQSPSEEPLGTPADFRSTPEPASLQLSQTNKSAEGGQFVAVTANPHATAAAREMLRNGGTAIDAAIAAQMVLGLVEPQSSGLGGGGFIVYWDAAKQQLFSYDGRETAPAKINENVFLDKQGKPKPWFDAVIGGNSVGVPGLVRMLELAHQKHGGLDWSSLFTPAIHLADQGFEISPRLHALLSQVPQVAVRKPIGRYLFDGDKPLPQGKRVKNTAYANTLRKLAASGADAFYLGDLARDMVEVVQSDNNSGALSIDDLAAYEALIRPPVCYAILEHRLCGMGPPSSGPLTVVAILAQMETLLQQEKLEYGVAINNDATVAHAFAEATRLAFADRNAYMADPDFVDVPVNHLLNSEYLIERAALINWDKALADPQPGLGESFAKRVPGLSLELPSTTHLSIIDQKGNVLSMTTSIETAFGSRLMSNGFLLNNQLTDFSFSPRRADGGLVANRVQPRKRPRSSMSPMIVFDGHEQPVLAIGSPGGSSIISYVARVLYDHLVGDLSIEDAVSAKHIVAGKVVKLEDGFSPTIAEALEKKGHRIRFGHQTSGLHILKRMNEGWLGVADPRREGSVIAE